jgi:quercetin dioxygenase-like cupin family protein
MSRKKHDSSCDVPTATVRKILDRNTMYTFQDGFRWKGVRVEKYKPDGNDWSDIIRQVLIGPERESTKFHVRYFELGPGGFSSHETHNHAHVVIGARGKGKARLNNRNREIAFLDVLYISPGTPHRFYNPYDEPFGFICIVDAKRDRPQPVKTKKSKTGQIIGRSKFQTFPCP